MLLAISFCAVVLAVGFGVLRLFGLTEGLLGLGLAPAAGLALLAVVATWTTLAGTPPVMGTVALVVATLFGLYVAIREHNAARNALSSAGKLRAPLAVFCLSVIVPAVILGIAFGDLQVPLSTHDGAYHVETIQAMRAGDGWQGWYPPGYHAAVAAFLGLVPWVDSAVGTFQVSLGLTLLAQVGVFGLGCAVWRRPLVAAIGALLVSLTYQYPYTIHFWALWPMLAGLIQVMALWAAGFYYVESAGIRWALFCSLLAAAIGLTHTIEVYTAIIGLVCILAVHWRRVAWWQLARHACLTVALALALVAPYVPPVLDWAQRGGAIATGAATGASAEGRLGPGGLPILLLDVAGGFLIDAPVRLLLACVGVWWALKQPNGRVLVITAGAFVVIPLALVYVDVGPIQWVFAATFPWSHGYRLLMVAALLLAMLGGAGIVSLARGLASLRAADAARRRQFGRVLTRTGAGVGLLVALAGVVLVPRRLGVEGAHDTIYLPDDVAAMSWLAEHASPGDLLANDSASDAGIWAPYKAGVKLLLPRLDHGERLDARVLVASQLDELDNPAAAQAACALGLRFVYLGASKSGFWDAHQFPPRERLRAAASLEEVFTQGEASIFRTQLPCAAPSA